MTPKHQIKVVFICLLSSRNIDDLQKTGHLADKNMESDFKSGVDVIDAICNEDGDAGEEESWSDEEGEDPNYSYNYSLKRKRYLAIIIF